MCALGGRSGALAHRLSPISELRHLPPSRTPRHAAPAPSRRRTTVLPAVLLLSVGLALGGLAVLPRTTHAPISLTAAAASAPVVIYDRQTIVSNRRDLSLLDGPSAEATRAPVRASRSRRVVPVKHVPEYVRPGVGVLTSGFKWRWGRMHTGIDIGVSYGTPIYAAASGQVIYAGWMDGYGNLVFIDHGRGIPLDQRGRIFEPFFRGRGNGKGGSGLGLAICRGFVEANGGRLLLQRPVNGHGASFAVSLPAGRPDAPA